MVNEEEDHETSEIVKLTTKERIQQMKDNLKQKREAVKKKDEDDG